MYYYDLNGNPTSATSARGKITLTAFDTLNRPTAVRFGASGTTEESRTTYGYDLADRVKTVTDSAAGVTTFTVNDRDQLTKSVTPRGTLDYTYDAVRRISMTAPGQAQVVHGYNDASQPTTLTRGSEVVTIGYDTAGRRATVTLPNAVVQTYGYDDASRLTSIGYTLATTTLGTLTHNYAPAGQLGHLGGTYARADIPAAYGPATYDDANQVTKVGTTVYVYDNDGNQTTDGTDPMGTNPKSTQDCLSNSFTPDTQVLMADHTTKPISDIKPGDEVLAGDPTTGHTEGHAVEVTIQGEGQKQLVDVSMDTNDDGTTDSTITATGGHPSRVAVRAVADVQGEVGGLGRHRGSGRLRGSAEHEVTADQDERHQRRSASAHGRTPSRGM